MSIERQNRQHQFTFDTVAPATSIVNAISDIKGQDPTELPPLGEAVDMEALDTLLLEGSDVGVSLEYLDLTIQVSSSGEIVVIE